MCFLFFFFFNDTATTEIYTLSLHDALPISEPRDAIEEIIEPYLIQKGFVQRTPRGRLLTPHAFRHRSEEHTSELQSRQYLVCRLLLEKKKHNNIPHIQYTCYTSYNSFYLYI